MTDINRPRTVALVDVSCLFKKNYEAMPGAGPREAAERTLSEFAAVREDTAHVILCLDAPRKEQPRYTRNAIYPEYKANRTAPSEQETAQKRWLLDRARKLGYQLARVEGWEADDVIATLARIYGEWCEEVRLVGGDKDLAQCVTENIVQYIPAVGTRKAEARNRLAVKAKFGVFPEQMALYLALMGDSSDNVPGVDKVGKQTAAKWASQYRTLTGLAEALAANGVNPPPRERVMWTNLANQWNALKMSLDLVTLNAHLPIDAEGLLVRLAPEPDQQGYTMSSDVELDGFERNATPPSDWAPEGEDIEQERTLMSADGHPTKAMFDLMASAAEADRQRGQPIIGKDPQADEVLRRATAERAAAAQRPDIAAAFGQAQPDSAVREEVKREAQGQSPLKAAFAAVGIDPVAVAAANAQGDAPGRPAVTDAQFEEGPKKAPQGAGKHQPGIVKAERDYGLVTEDLQPLDLRSAETVSKWLHHGGLYPQFGGPSGIFTVIMRGKELGLGVTTALAGFHVVEGRPTASADLIRALAKRSPKCKYFRLVASTSAYAEWETWNSDDPGPTTFRYDLEEAELAGLVRTDKKGNPGMWQKRPRDMLTKTAGAKLARLVYPAETLGLYCPEEMGETREEEAA
jgi:5'-3' exonuclease